LRCYLLEKQKMTRDSECVCEREREGGEGTGFTNGENEKVKVGRMFAVLSLRNRKWLNVCMRV